MKTIRRVSAGKYKGLGDVVHAVAKPIATASDKLFGTDLQHCKGCPQRRAVLNRWLPL